MRFENKSAIITGSGSGIGRACALKLAQDGAQVTICDVNTTGGQETVHQIEAFGGKAIFIQCDVTEAAQVEEMVKTTVKAFGSLDIAVNNAGIGAPMTNVHTLDEADWDRVININLKGVWLCMKYEIPALIQRSGGAIINISSMAGIVGFPFNAAYAASKHGVIGLTKSAALEYARLGIRVNAVCPAFTETPMVEQMMEEVPSMRERTLKMSPMRRLGTVAEIADAVVYLAGATASFVNGHALILDGGASAQ